jgi:hypothetical protein
MTQTLTISISVPDGTALSIAGVEGATLISAQTRDPVEEYWNDYLSANGRKVFGAAARFERRYGPGYSFEDLAKNLSVDYESVKSYHRNAGRTAARWEREKGVPAPVRLDFHGDYGPQPGVAGWRSRYTLPLGVADKIAELAQ